MLRHDCLDRERALCISVKSIVWHNIIPLPLAQINLLKSFGA